MKRIKSKEELTDDEIIVIRNSFGTLVMGEKIRADKNDVTMKYNFDMREFEFIFEEVLL